MEPPENLAPVKTHVLRPHHVIVTALLLLAFKGEPKPLPPTLMLDMIRLVLSETADVRHPTPFGEIILAIKTAAHNQRRAEDLANDLFRVPGYLITEASFTEFFNDVLMLTFEKEDDLLTAPCFERRSWFGLYVRRCRASYAKLSFAGVHKFMKDFRAWCDGDASAGYDLQETDRWNGLLITTSIADEKVYAQHYRYEEYEKAAAVGDYEGATNNIRAYFDQRFSDSNDSGIRQYALITLAQYHYSLGHMEECRRILKEAVIESRSNADGPALKHATALLRRIPPPNPPQRSNEAYLEAISRQVTEEVIMGKPQPKYAEINADTSPLDLLWDVQQVLTNAHPIRLAFQKLYQAVGIMDAAKDDLAEHHSVQWPWHLMQAQIWRVAGMPTLAVTHEAIVVAHTQPGVADESRIIALCSRARTLARAGSYIKAMTVMFDYDTWRGLNLRQYNVWAAEIWKIFALRAGRRGQIKLYDDFLAAKRPASADLIKRDFFMFWDRDQLIPFKPKTVREHLQMVLVAKKEKRLISALPHLFEVLFTTELTGMYELYRTAVTLFTDASLELGMTKLAIKNMEEIMPKLILGDDLEQRALAFVVLARCHLAAGEGSTESLEEALSLLQRAANDYRLLEMMSPLQDTEYLISVVLHNLKRFPERDTAIKRCWEAEEEKNRAEAEDADDDMIDAWQLVCDIGASIAAR